MKIINKNRQEKGITLIALIITIIVMLILVAVSIQVVINSGIFDSAKNAAKGTQDKAREEASLGSEIVIDGKTYASAEDYVKGIEKIVEVHNWQYTDNTMSEVKCECEECKKINAAGVTYSIGQQVKRTSSDTLLGESETATGTEWVVLGIENCNKSETNTTNETLLITTLAPSSETLRLEGADGYNNGIAKIEAKVKEIYGNEARAMTIDDVNRTLGYTPAGGMYYDGSTYKTTGNFTTKLSELGEDYDNIWSNIQSYNESNCGGKYYTPEYPEGPTDASELGNYVLDGYWYAMDANVGAPTGVPLVPTTTSNVAKNLIFGTVTADSTNVYVNWLTSHGVGATYDNALFGPGGVNEGNAISYFSLFNSSGASSGARLPVRAVVSLRSEVPEGGRVLVSSDAWTME